MTAHLQEAAERAARTDLVALLERWADDPARALNEALLLGIRIGAAEATAQAIEQGADVTLTFEEPR